MAYADLLGLLGGFFVVEPNQSAVLMLFGTYKGSERRPGLWWVNPFMTKKKVTLRVRNFESSKLKVNDHDGNPIEIELTNITRLPARASLSIMWFFECGW